METGSNDNVVRVSLVMVLLGIGGMFVVGLLGGLTALQIWPREMPLSNNQTQLVTTTQEVTISPSTSAVEMIRESNRSVYLLIDKISGKKLGTAVVMTNDGVLATTATLPKTDIIGIDYQGNLVQLERMGNDAIYSIEWLKVQSAVLTPVDIRSTEPGIGYHLTALSRSESGGALKSRDFGLNEYSLAPEISASGIQRLIKGPILAGDEWRGAPLLDEEGKLAGLLLKPESGLALTTKDVAESFTRLAEGRRESNLLADLGLTLKFTFATIDANSKMQFVAEVNSVSANSPAALAIMKQGDYIVAIGEDQVIWQDSVLKLLEKDMPLNITVLRGEKKIQLLIHEIRANKAE